MTRRVSSLLMTHLTLVSSLLQNDRPATISATLLLARTGTHVTQGQDNIISVSTHLRSHSMRGTRGARIADLRSVVPTLRWRLPCSGIHLTSDTTAQQQQHTSASVYACPLLYSCVHAMRALTWSAAAALPLCNAREFEFVWQRQALSLRNRDSLPERIAIRIELQQ